MELLEILEDSPKNQIIGDNLVRAYSKINNPNYKNIICSISGGADSDIVLDICTKCDKDKKIKYVWFDTGLEYQATKEHLEYLENKYEVEIIKHKAIKPIPFVCKQYGQPFLSKRVSQFIHSLQINNFKFEDKTYEELCEEYPKIKSTIKWWCNLYECNAFNISNNKWLKEFMINNPPKFNINDVCCSYSKKKVIHKIIKDNNCDLNINGVRKAEGGTRATAFKSCFNEDSECDKYRPIFWYTNNDKIDYETYYKILHSKCYTEYGLKRTGCAGCPFGRDFEFELEVIEKYEPKLFKAVNNIFGDSYEYTRKYRMFYEEKEKELHNC